MGHGSRSMLDRGPDGEIIQHQWYAVARSAALGKEPLPLKRLGIELVAWRDAEGVAHVADAACPHRGAHLGLGRVIQGALECPYHGFRYDRRGQCSLMPCEGADAVIPRTMRLRMHTCREAHGFVWMWCGDDVRELPELPWLPGAPEPSRVAAEDEMLWNVRLSRVMEGMLDVHHFPFVHRRYSPFSLTRLDPYDVRVVDQRIYTRGTLRTEGGEGARFTLEINVAFPGVLQLVFSSRLQGVAVCTPVDDEHTWIGLRYVQTCVTLPVLGQLLSWLSLWSELQLIQPDDHRMLLSSSPRGSHPRLNHFVHADRGIAAWHRLRLRAMGRDQEEMSEHAPTALPETEL